MIHLIIHQFTVNLTPPRIPTSTSTRRRRNIRIRCLTSRILILAFSSRTALAIPAAAPADGPRATRNVGVKAGIVLRRASLDASVGHGTARVSWALSGVLRSVKLEGVLFVVGEEIVAREDRGFDVSHTVSTRVTGIGGAGWENADVRHGGWNAACACGCRRCC